jgi:hypothetical protein
VAANVAESAGIGAHTHTAAAAADAGAGAAAAAAARVGAGGQGSGDATESECAGGADGVGVGGGVGPSAAAAAAGPCPPCVPTLTPVVRLQSEPLSLLQLSAHPAWMDRPPAQWAGVTLAVRAGQAGSGTGAGGTTDSTTDSTTGGTTGSTIDTAGAGGTTDGATGATTGATTGGTTDSSTGAGGTAADGTPRAPLAPPLPWACRADDRALWGDTQVGGRERERESRQTALGIPCHMLCFAVGAATHSRCAVKELSRQQHDSP